ncbi:MAG: hypothetical protein L0Y67_08375 [Gammaproteobacteria bacterium]|nr:hypothetical protein [Gammaproteobacteria bacterium]MCI0591591.1 hypothetical protein [Gammaproteobacteria bacterium]
MNAILAIEPPVITEVQIAQILQHRYGDGLVYLPKSAPRAVLSRAVQLGFVDADGYLTRKGRLLLARYQFI